MLRGRRTQPSPGPTIGQGAGHIRAWAGKVGGMGLESRRWLRWDKCLGTQGSLRAGGLCGASGAPLAAAGPGPRGGET